MKARFMPSVDDYIHIASTANSNHVRTFDRYAYSAFLCVNAVCFPAYLILSDHLIFGLSVFGFNVAVYVLCIAGMNKKYYKRYWERTMEGAEGELVEIELTAQGVTQCFHGNSVIITWKNISKIEERKDTIFFNYRGGAIAVRKVAFESDSEKETFIDVAQEFRKARV